MSFIKNNLYLVVLGAVTLVLVVGLLSYSLGGLLPDVRERVEQRERLSTDILGLRGAQASREKMEAAKTDVEALQAAYQRMLETVHRLNQSEYQVLQVPIGMADGETAPAFPVDPELYQTHQVPLSFARQYYQQMQALYDQLGGVSPATTLQIEQEFVRLQGIRRQELLGESDSGPLVPLGVPAAMVPTNRTTGGAGLAPTLGGESMIGPPGGGGYYGDQPYGPPGGMMGPGSYGSEPGLGPPGGASYGGPMLGPNYGNYPAGSSSAAAAIPPQELLELRNQAAANVKVRQARSGSLYVEPIDVIFDRYPLSTALQPGPEDMWKAQVNYWIHKSVVQAILDVNQAARADESTAQTVLTSPIRRLIRIDAGGTQPYVLTGTEVTGGQQDSYAYGGGQGMMGPPMGGPMMGSVDASAKAPTLTQRICNQDYDVLRYRVQVVMDSSRLFSLLQRLQANQWSTILNVQVRAAEDVTFSEIGAGGGGMGGQPLHQGFYYGPAPVVEVTLTVETLLFTQWERDLMPVEMLQALQRANSNALRPVDLERIQQATGGSSGGMMF